MRTSEAVGWGVRVDGPEPYLAYEFYTNKFDAEESCDKSYHRPVRVAIIPLREFRRLRKLDRER